MLHENQEVIVDLSLFLKKLRREFGPFLAHHTLELGLIKHMKSVQNTPHIQVE
ncbi:hypothetical protein D3C81_2116160 [compost metagenome]